MHINLLTTAIFVLASLGAATISQDEKRHELSNEQSLNPRLTTVPLLARDLPTGTCNAGTPCANGACCSKTNLCGYSKDFCGDGCQHNCKSYDPSAIGCPLKKDVQAMRKLNADHMQLKVVKSALLTFAVPNSGIVDQPKSFVSGTTRMIHCILRVIPSTEDVAM